MQNIIVILVTLGSFAFGYFVVYRFGLFLDARGKMMDEAAENSEQPAQSMRGNAV